MKKIILGFASVVALVSTSSYGAQTGNEGGGGGSVCMAEVMQSVSKLSNWVASNPGKVAVSSVTIESVATPDLFQIIPDSTPLTYKGNPVDAYFNGISVQIKCNQLLSHDLKARTLLIAHEIFRKLKIEGDNYEVTRKLDLSGEQLVPINGNSPSPLHYGPFYDASWLQNQYFTRLEIDWFSEQKILVSAYQNGNGYNQFEVNNQTQVIKNLTTGGEDRGYVKFESNYKIWFYHSNEQKMYRSGASIQCAQNQWGNLCINKTLIWLDTIWQHTEFSTILKGDDDSYIFLLNRGGSLLPIFFTRDKLATMRNLTTSGCLRRICVGDGNSYAVFNDEYNGGEEPIIRALLGFVGNQYVYSGDIVSGARLVDTLYFDKKIIFVAEFNSGSRCDETSTAEQGRIQERLQKQASVKCNAGSDLCQKKKDFSKLETPGGNCVFSATAYGYKKASD